LETTLLKNHKESVCTEKSGFKVPEDYFSSFELQTPKLEKEVKVVQLNNWTRWIAAAAIITFALISALYIDNISPGKNLEFSDLEDDIIEKYLDIHLETPDEFIDYDSTTLGNIIENNIITLNNQDIMDYLNDKLEDQDYDD
jgi:hypothetical protein